METAMLVAMFLAEAAVPADGGAVPRTRSAPSYRVTRLAEAAIAPMSLRRCRGVVPAANAAAAGPAIDADCVRLMMRARPVAQDERSGAPGVAPHAPAGTPSDGWRLASAMLPALQGLFGRGGAGIGFGSELALVRGARFTWHMAAPHDTRIAATMFAPETTVLARCGACWNQSEVAGAGLTAMRRTAAAAIETVARARVPAG